MEEWNSGSKTTKPSREYFRSRSSIELHNLLSGRHQWQPMSHARPTYCNICRDALSGVTSHGLSCEICKCKVHKRCASKAINNCKWTTLASIGKDIIEDKDGNIHMPHQWMEGNLPVSAKCAVCEKTCGSVLRLQDWRCLWCKATVHTACRPNHPVRCNLGPSRVSVVPPTSLHSVGTDDAWEAVRPQGSSPLLVFVNSKSGDNQGIKFHKRFKQLLNPAQVFDLIATGPTLGLRLFRHFDPFRVLVCSGDGSVGWVLSEIDRLKMTNQCQVGVLPLGTGNDLARVLGWGSSCDDDANLTQLLDRYEKATTKTLDRWSIMTYERPMSDAQQPKHSLSSVIPTMAAYETSVVSHLTNILESNQHASILESAKILCETVKEFTMRAGEISFTQGDEELSRKCDVLREKLDQMLSSLHEEGLVEEDGEEKSSKELPEKESDESELGANTRKQETLKMRANSLKRAVRQLIEHSERVVDEQADDRAMVEQNLENTAQDYLKVDRSRLLSISPLPNVRRDSAASSTSDVMGLETLPVPSEFADSRRGSATQSPFPGTPGEEFPCTLSVTLDIPSHLTPGPVILNRALTPESLTSASGPQPFDEDKDIDEGILSRIKSEDLTNIGHIDSSETSDESPEGTVEKEKPDITVFKAFSRKSRKSVKSKFGSYETVDATNLISTSPEEEDDYDDFALELGLDASTAKRASIAHFIEGSDIARRSIKCRHKKLSLDDLDLFKVDTGLKLDQPGSLIPVPTIQISSSDNELPDPASPKKLTPGYLDVVEVRIQGSESNLHASTDGMYLGLDHRKSLALSETDDEELMRFNPLRWKGQNIGVAPQVVINPPSPTGEDSPVRRLSYDCCRKLSAASPCALLRPDPTEEKPVPDKRLPIINPLVRLPTWPNTSGSGLISKVLLANADALCAPAVPLMDPQESLMEGFQVKSIMNNYFGIGIDAKIALDFHNKREEHPEKCRSRAKNYMWYGVLGSKEWLQKTYKNLEQRVQLECDGQRIPLPSLQGIVILNIPSFMGGTNFWGGTKEGEVFLAPSVDDKILEVVAVFGSVQMAASRLINLQHHRIAQCQTVQINIIGDEGVPVQVDGEAWIQPPGVIRIIHKNKMRMLCRNRALEESLKTWEEKQRHGNKGRSSLSHIPTSNELQLLLSFIESTTTLVKCVKVLIIRHPTIEADLYELADRTASNLEKVHPSGKIQQGPEFRSLLGDLVSSAKELHDEACVLLREKAADMQLQPELESQLNGALAAMESELRRCHMSEGSQSFVYLQQSPDHDRKNKSKGLSWLKFRRDKLEKGESSKGAKDVNSWGVQEVGAWLESIQLGEYAEAFAGHDIRGRELITLTRRDLKELGVTKIGHVKRLLSAAKDLASS